MKRFRQVLISGMIASILIWGGVAAYMLRGEIAQTEPPMPQELEKFDHIIKKSLEAQTYALEQALNQQNLADLIQKADESRFYSKKLEFALLDIMRQSKLHILSVVSTSGETIIRGSNDDFKGDALFYKNYDSDLQPAARLQDLVSLTMNGKSISTIDLLPRSVLDHEYKKAKFEENIWYRFPLSDVAEMAYLDMDGNLLYVGDSSKETRGLAELSFIPIEDNHQTIAVVIGGYLLSRDSDLLYQFHRVSNGENLHPTIAIDGLRVATTLPISDGQLRGRPALNTFVSENINHKFQLALYNHFGTAVGTLILESEPTKWVKTPPIALLNKNIHAPRNTEITKEELEAYKSTDIPLMPLVYLLTAALLGLLILLITAATIKELVLLIGNALMRRKYLAYTNRASNHLRQQARLRNLKREIKELKMVVKTSTDGHGVDVPNITDREIDDIISFLP